MIFTHEVQCGARRRVFYFALPVVAFVQPLLPQTIVSYDGLASSFRRLTHRYMLKHCRNHPLSRLSKGNAQAARRRGRDRDSRNFG